jgi:hypothetical protein
MCNGTPWMVEWRAGSWTPRDLPECGGRSRTRCWSAPLSTSSWSRCSLLGPPLHTKSLAQRTLNDVGTGSQPAPPSQSLEDRSG